MRSRYGRTPDYVVGDLDSVTEENSAGLPHDRLILVDADGGRVLAGEEAGAGGRTDVGFGH
jgi:hypothetical protein